ncbi:flagellar basal-body rod protein flgc [Ralstonia solanacearum IPO1609]|uniref:Flagellar basal-body rod protein FlgC n=6 Tax=Ralstonia solanacearum TaxID=305 RepID=A0A7U7PRM8_RALSL|nr:flagellar basal-body rod protein flgc [Ralstonia solanacearum IPO1609]
MCGAPGRTVSARRASPCDERIESDNAFNDSGTDMSLFKVMDVAGSALTAQSKRMNVVASNLANAESVTGPDGTAYRAKQVVFSPEQGTDGYATGVSVDGVVEDTVTPMKRMHQPGNPLADADGYVTMPNVDVVDEMVNMISASRSYQANVEVANTTKTMAAKALTLGQ